MKTRISLKVVFALLIVFSIGSCKKDDVSPDEVKKTVTFKFKAKANQMSDFMGGMIMFQNAKGNKFGVTKLKYVVSGFVLYKTDGTKHKIEGYHFVDINDPSTLSFKPSKKISAGSYNQIEMVFGLTPENNVSFSHPDLNVISWNWPDMMGGGYHFMQLEGDFIDNNSDTSMYLTHLGPTIDPNNETINNEIHIMMPKNFTVPQVASNVSIDIEMNIDQWYENPNTIDLNQYGAAIMGNYDAQILFNANGESGVFKIGSVKNN